MGMCGGVCIDVGGGEDYDSPAACVCHRFKAE